MLTSEGCAHCEESRGTGFMGNKKEYMKPSYIEDILNVSDNITFLNIHYDDMNGNLENIVEISKFYKNDKGIVQQKWIRSNNDILNVKILANKKERKFVNTSTTEIKGKWRDFVSARIPKKLENYTYYYPCFAMVGLNDWLMSINENTDIIAMVNAGVTRRYHDRVALDIDGESLNKKILKPKELIEKVTSGKVQLTVNGIVEFYYGTTQPEIKEESEEPKEQTISNTRVLIRAY